MATKKVRIRECFVGLSSTVINLWSLVTGSEVEALSPFTWVWLGLVVMLVGMVWISVLGMVGIVSQCHHHQ